MEDGRAHFANDGMFCVRVCADPETVVAAAFLRQQVVQLPSSHFAMFCFSTDASQNGTGSRAHWLLWIPAMAKLPDNPCFAQHTGHLD